MRGPGVRLDLDVRRVWQCPACQRIRRLPGDLTAVRCTCAGEPWMQLVGERRAALRGQTSLQARELTVESFQLTEEELAKPLPGRVRRRGPGRGDAPGLEAPAGSPPAGSPDRAAAGPTEPNPRDNRGGRPEQPAGNAARRPRPPRPPRGSKRPLSDIAGSAEPSSEAVTPPPSENPQPPNDDFSAGIDVPDTSNNTP